MDAYMFSLIMIPLTLVGALFALPLVAIVGVAIWNRIDEEMV